MQQRTLVVVFNVLCTEIVSYGSCASLLLVLFFKNETILSEQDVITCSGNCLAISKPP